MRNYEYDYIFTNDSENKVLEMTSSTISITNTDIVGEDFEIEDILNDEEDLLFGSVYASRIKFGTTYQTDLSDVTLDVSCYPPEHSSTIFNFGAFKITKEDFVENQGMNKYKEAVGYDALYDVLNTNYIDWYNALFPTSSTTKTQKQFRDSFFNYVGITQETVTLPNDSMTVRKTVSGAELKGSTILRAICACNGCFGRMVENKFKYIFLTPIAQDLSNAYEIALNGHYISEKHAKYTVNPIDKLIIRDDDTELIAEYPTGSANNPYVMANNFLLYDKTANELSTIAQNIYAKIQGISYVPLEIEVKGNPCFEVGDPVYFTTVGGEVVKSYILRRNYVGFQSPHDTYVSNGLETRKFTTESFDTSLYKLYNKTNQLIRDLEHTESILQDEVLDPDNPFSLQSQIYQSASVISAKVDQINGTSGDSFSYEMTSTKAEFKNNGNTVLKLDSTGAFIGNGSNGFQIGTTNIHNGMTSLSDTTHNGIYLGTDGIALGKGNFKVTNAGALTAKSGYIGNGSSGFTIGNTAIYNGVTSMSDTSHNGIYLGTDGIALGKGVFKVTNAGYLTATSGRISSFDIETLGINFHNEVFPDDYMRIGLSRATTPYRDYEITANRKLTISGTQGLELSVSNVIDAVTGNIINKSSAQNISLVAGDQKLTLEVNGTYWRCVAGTDGLVRLGDSNRRWGQIYSNSATISTSDRKEKKNIKSLLNSAKEFIMKLKPVSYVFKDGKRTHFGLIAQDVEETMTELGMTDMDFGGLCKDKKENSDEYTYGLRYEEFIAPLIKTVQMQQKEIDELKSELKEIKELLKGDLK